LPRFAGLALAMLLAHACAAPARADARVTFPSAAASGRSGRQIQGYLAIPEGAGPFPAVVLLHSCLGLPSNRRAIEAALTAQGYAALFVDEFSTRGLKETCAVDFPQGLGDAYGALAFLARLPEVDPDRIAAVGFSQGADTALKIAASRPAPAFALSRGAKFRAAAAFYPPCANVEGRRLATPTLILVGSADGVTPAADCERLAKNNADTAKLIVYPGAAHCFDDPAFRGGRSVLGMVLKYDPAAAKASRRDLGAFLAETLAR
jgi:dienelactone hydrolase